MTSQQAMYYAAVRQLGERDEAFMDILHDGLTRQELAANIERRPSLWGRYAGFLRFLPSSPLEGENSQHVGKNTNLIPYRVMLHEDPGVKFLIAFDCMAEDDDHAVEQAENAYPGCEIINFLPFDWS